MAHAKDIKMAELARQDTELAAGDVRLELRIHAKTILVVLAINLLYAAQLIAIVGAGVLAVPMTSLVGGSDQLVWFTVLVNILTIALSAPLSQAVDFWGRRWILIATTGFGLAGSLVISRAMNIAALIAGFAVMSVNFGSMPVLYAVTSEVLPRKHRVIGQSFQQCVGTAATVLGLMAGTALVNDGDLTRFRIFWYMTSGFFGASIIGLFFGYKPPPRSLQQSLNTAEKLRRLDWAGISLFAPALVLFCIALAWTNNPYSWSDAHILATFILSILLLIVFGIYEWRFKSDGIFHHKLMTRNFLIGCAVAFDEGLAFFTANSYLVFEAQVYYNKDPLSASYPYLILICAATASALLMGFFSTRYKSIKLPVVFGIGLVLVFCACMATLVPTNSFATMMGYSVLGGFGDGMILPAVMVVAQLSTPADLIALTSAMILTLRSVGGTVGPVVNSALYNSAISANLVPKINATVVPMGFPEYLVEELAANLNSQNYDAVFAMSGVTQEIVEQASLALADAYSVAFRHCWTAAACFAAVGVLLSLFLKNPRTEFNEHIDAPAEAELVRIQTQIESGDYAKVASAARS